MMKYKERMKKRSVHSDVNILKNSESKYASQYLDSQLGTEEKFASKPSSDHVSEKESQKFMKYVFLMRSNGYKVILDDKNEELYRKLLESRQRMRNMYKEGIHARVTKDDDSYIINQKKPRPRDIMKLYNKRVDKSLSDDEHSHIFDEIQNKSIRENLTTFTNEHHDEMRNDYEIIYSDFPHNKSAMNTSKSARTTNSFIKNSNIINQRNEFKSFDLNSKMVSASKNLASQCEKFYTSTQQTFENSNAYYNKDLDHEDSSQYLATLSEYDLPEDVYNFLDDSGKYRTVHDMKHLSLSKKRNSNKLEIPKVDYRRRKNSSQHRRDDVNLIAQDHKPETSNSIKCNMKNAKIRKYRLNSNI